MSVERIRLQPEEIVELVEERLAWLAVASTGKHSYTPAFYRRAAPTIRLGKGASGYIDVAGVEASDERPLTDGDTFTADLSRAARSCWTGLGEPMRYAELSDEDPELETLSRVSAKSYAELSAADFFEGPPTESFATVGLRGVRFQLQAFGALSRAGSQTTLARTPYAQLPCIAYQEVSQLADGRSVSGSLYMARLPNGELVLPGSRATFNAHWATLVNSLPPEVIAGSISFRVCRNDSGHLVHPIQDRFERFLVHQYNRRKDWTVELSLSKSRTGIGLATDALGARELAHAMQLDGASNPSRRKALLHWVREHMRRQRNGHESVVRSHLRGAREFQAGPYWTTIWPSREVLEASCNAARHESAQ